MGDATRPAVGARAKIHYGEETTYGQMATLDHVLRFTSESVVNELNVLVSAELRDDRAYNTSVIGSSSVGGDINYEQNTEGQSIFLKHGYGEHLTMQGVDGGIAAISTMAFDNDSTSDLPTDRNLVTEGFDSGGGNGVIIQRDLTTKDLTYESFSYSGIGGTDNNTFTGVGATGGGTLSTDYSKGSRIFSEDSTNWSLVYTHLIDVAPVLPTGLSLEILRDIVAFFYTGCKVNTLNEVFPSNDICTGTYGMMGKIEQSVGLLGAAASIGDTYIVLRNATEYGMFPSGGGTLIIGQETNITYTGKAIVSNEYRLTGIPGAGDNSIEVDHAINAPVSLQSTTGSGSVSDTDPLSSFMGEFFFDSTSYEIMSGEYTINNNLFPDKIPFGEIGRAKLPEQQREVTGTFNIEFDDMLMYAKFVNGLAAKAEIACIDDTVDGEIDDSDVFRQKYVVFPSIKFNGTTPTVADANLITVDMPFQAFPDDENNLPEAYCILVNSESSI